jgi:hypothetical protein
MNFLKIIGIPNQNQSALSRSATAVVNAGVCATGVSTRGEAGLFP